MKNFRGMKHGAIGLAGMLVIATAGCSDQAAGSAATTLTVLDYGGPYQQAHEKEYFAPCAEELGVNIKTDEPTDFSKIRTAVEANNVPWDVVNFTNDFGSDAAGGDYLEPIDYSIVDKSQLVDGYADKYRVGSDIEATVVAYNTDKISGTPHSFADLFDTKTFPGKRTFYRSVSSGVLEAALIADGVAPKDLYPLDLDRAFAKLDTIKKDIIWWETGAASQSMLASGEAAMGLVWVGRAVDAAKTDGAPVKVSYDQWLQIDDYWGIPKGAKNAELSNKLINCMNDKKKQVAWSQLMVYGPVNKEAAKDPTVTSEVNRPTNHLEKQIKVDDDYWAANYAKIAERFNDWIAQ
ncbi:ABC transporter substrate-binding protein [Arthrobacter sp. GCM10027362]|uniref:ABC transporter substrate-binding protein n=1 Tax=Arthrobacter sp. GCM10027362 TaxID=3273379 RepID=UPI003633E7D8